MAENARMLRLYLAALTELNAEQRWKSNYRAFMRWDHAQRLKWIAYIEKQAAQGLPMAEQLMSRALFIRMTK